MRIGIDIADVDQLGALAARPRFLELVFTPEERAGAQTRSGRRRAEYLAGRFAGKEAVVKLLGTGFVRDAWWRDVEIVADAAGAPVARLHRGAAAVARRLGAEPIALSISHQGPWAIAVAAAGGQAGPVR
jgi:holo-[acyl-carrier protein] synthase